MIQERTGNIFPWNIFLSHVEKDEKRVGKCLRKGYKVMCWRRKLISVSCTTEIFLCRYHYVPQSSGLKHQPWIFKSVKFHNLQLGIRVAQCVLTF